VGETEPEHRDAATGADVMIERARFKWAATIATATLIHGWITLQGVAGGDCNPQTSGQAR